MAFTNIFDVTFPADTELANLIGANLRQVRLDVQQRMAAISGLDASKPAFGSDTQPANWNGILFFATDTGKVYQWNNPVWTDITSNINAGRMMGSVFSTAGASINAGLTEYFPPDNKSVSTTEAIVQLPMAQAGTFRSMFVLTSGAQPGTGTLVVTLRKNGVSQAITITIPANGAAGTYSDVAHTVAFVAGDLITVQVVNNAASLSAALQAITLGY